LSKVGGKMKKYIPFILLVLFISLNCATANLLKNPIKYEGTQRPNKSKHIAVITLFQYESGNDHDVSQEAVSSLRHSLKAALENTAVFKEVHLEKNKVKYPRGTIFFDIKMNAKEVGKFNWWITWPAVYPMCAYWPLQMKSGQVVVDLNAKVFDVNGKVTSIHVSHSIKYDITFYGFFRTSPIKKAAEITYLKLLEKFRARVISYKNPALVKSIKEGM
jgi:hypothetical protein